MYFRNVGQVNRKTGELTLVKRIDLGELNQKLKEVHTNLNHPSIPKQDPLINRAKEALKEAELRLSQTFKIIGGNINNRAKRGLFNGVGTGFKYLFGTMSADDEQEIRNRLSQNQAEVTELHKQIESAVSIMNEINEASTMIKARQEEERNLINKVLKKTNDLEYKFNELGDKLIADEIAVNFINWISI